MSVDVSYSAVLPRCRQGVVFVQPCVCVCVSPEHTCFSLFVLPSITLHQVVVFNEERRNLTKAEKSEVLTDKCHSLFLDFYSLWVVSQSKHERWETRGLFVYLFGCVITNLVLHVASWGNVTSHSGSSARTDGRPLKAPVKRQEPRFDTRWHIFFWNGKSEWRLEEALDWFTQRRSRYAVPHPHPI